MRDRPEHAEDEDEASDVEGDDQLAQGEQRAGAELADGEGNGAERADRRRPHHDGDDAKEHVRGRPDQIVQGLPGRAPIQPSANPLNTDTYRT